MGGGSVEIVCTECGADTLIRREPRHEGFAKVGEDFLCAACGHRYTDESEVPFKVRKEVSVFTEADKAKTIDVFAGDEKGRNCRHCAHYLVNPFIQRCGLHERKVLATDCCDDFEAEPDEPISE